MAPITSIERYRRTLLFQQLGDTPAQIRALGGGATQFTHQRGHGGTCGAPDGRWDLRGRRVAGAAEFHGQPGPALRDADPTFTTGAILRRAWRSPGRRRQRAEAREDRAARRIRHLLRPLRAGQYAGRAALQRAGAAAVRGFEPGLLPQRAATRRAGGFPVDAGDAGGQLAYAGAVHPAIGGHGGAAAARQHDDGGDLYELARAAPLPLGRHQRAAAGHLQSGSGEQRAVSAGASPGRWS